MEFLCGTGAIGSSMKFFFHPYKEHLKQTPYATWVLFLVRAAPRLQGGLEIELFWASSLATSTKLALGLLLYLGILDGLLFHVMHQSWSYAWVSCPHHPPLLGEMPSSALSVL
jgi:hypothetical protein